METLRQLLHLVPFQLVHSVKRLRTLLHESFIILSLSLYLSLSLSLCLCLLCSCLCDHLHEQQHGSLAADECEDVEEDPVDDHLLRRLLLEDHATQVEENLHSLHRELFHREQLGVPQADATELEVPLEHHLVLLVEVALAVLVDHLTHSQHLPTLVLDRRAHHRLGRVPGQLVDLHVEPGVFVAIVHNRRFPRLCHVSDNANPPLNLKKSKYKRKYKIQTQILPQFDLSTYLGGKPTLISCSLISSTVEVLLTSNRLETCARKPVSLQIYFYQGIFLTRYSGSFLGSPLTRKSEHLSAPVRMPTFWRIL